MFWSLFIFRGHSTPEPPSRTVTWFIMRAYTETDVSHSRHRKNSGEVLENMQVNGPEKCGNSEEEIPGSKRSMDSYIPTYFRL